MDETQANAVAEALHGIAWDSGGGIWIVRIHAANNVIVDISDEVLNIYETEEDAEDESPLQYILLV